MYLCAIAQTEDPDDRTFRTAFEEHVTPLQRETVGAIRFELQHSGAIVRLQSYQSDASVHCDVAGKLSIRCPRCRGLVCKEVSVEEAIDALLHRRVVGPPKEAVFFNRLLNTVIVFYLGLGMLAALLDVLWIGDLELTSYVGAAWLKNLLHSYLLFVRPPRVADFVVPLAIIAGALGYKLLFITPYMTRAPDRCLCPEELFC